MTDTLNSLPDPFDTDFKPATNVELPPEPTYIISSSGFAVDRESGEYIGRVGADGQIIVEKESFHITTEAQIGWALRALTSHQSDIHNLKIAIAKAGEMIASHQKAHDGFLNHFEDDLKVYALANLKKGTKKCETMWGDLKFRDVNGTTVNVLDESQAIAWALDNCPDAAKPKSGYTLLRTPLNTFEGDFPEFIKRVPPHTTFDVDTAFEAEQRRMEAARKKAANQNG